MSILHKVECAWRHRFPLSWAQMSSVARVELDLMIY